MPQSFFQVAVVGLLFIIAAIFFPPLLLLIPLAACGLILNGIANLFRGEKKSDTFTHEAVMEAMQQIEHEDAARKALLIAPSRRTEAQPVRPAKPYRRNPRYVPPKIITRPTDETGMELVNLINSTAERSSLTAVEVANEIRARSNVPFLLYDGKVHITEDQLSQIEPHMTAIRNYCASIE